MRTKYLLIWMLAGTACLTMAADGLARQIVVAGAGEPHCNGLYDEVGPNPYGKPYFVQIAGEGFPPDPSMLIEWTGAPPEWYIYRFPETLTPFYVHPLDTPLPPRDGWLPGIGVPPYPLPTLSGDGSLPVELSSFAASSENNAVVLRWVTHSEVDNVGFHVYRALSEDGEYVRLTPQLLSGAGTSANLHTYTFMDPNVVEGATYWYRLEDVDFSGNTRMHGPVSVQVTKAEPTAFALAQNTPNPFNPLTTISYDLPEAGDVTLTIYALSGQQVATLVAAHQAAGHYEVVWDGSKFATGLYLYRLEAGRFVETRRMLLLK